MKTVLITGCSSGYGLDTARHFHAQSWNVIATMRMPREDILPPFGATARPGARRDQAREHRRRESRRRGRFDVLVNNAGIGIVGAFEATPMATVRGVFETNTFGVMVMTQAVLPLFRERRSGVVVNVPSSVTMARILHKQAANTGALHSLTRVRKRRPAVREPASVADAGVACLPGFQPRKAVRYQGLLI